MRAGPGLLSLMCVAGIVCDAYLYHLGTGCAAMTAPLHRFGLPTSIPRQGSFETPCKRRQLTSGRELVGAALSSLIRPPFSSSFHLLLPLSTLSLPRQYIVLYCFTQSSGTISSRLPSPLSQRRSTPTKPTDVPARSSKPNQPSGPDSHSRGHRANASKSIKEDAASKNPAKCISLSHPSQRKIRANEYAPIQQFSLRQPSQPFRLSTNPPLLHPPVFTICKHFTVPLLRLHHTANSVACFSSTCSRAPCINEIDCSHQTTNPCCHP